MAKSAKARRVLASLTVPTKVEIRQPEFEPLKSLAALDLRRLSKGNHKIEIGLIKGGCCPHVVRAVIRNGMAAKLRAARKPAPSSRHANFPH